MILEHLPEELLLLILRQLDIQSIYSLYNTGIPHVQNVIASGDIKKCDISRSTLATVNTLHTPFFMDISENLVKLDLKGVQDLNKKSLLSTMKTMSKLSTLNIAYTNITIFDFLKIYDQCPSIKNICMNYEFTNNRDAHFSEELFSKCQGVFGNMEKVNFVGGYSNLLESSLPNLILQEANLISLTYTLAKNSEDITYYKYMECKPINHANFNLTIPQWRKTSFMASNLHLYENDNELNILKTLNSGYDFIQIYRGLIKCSPAFKSFFVNFGIRPKVKTILSHYSFTTPQVFMSWDQKKVTYDEKFFKQLVCAVTPLLKCKVSNIDDRNSEYSNESDSGPSSSKSNWVWMIHSRENFNHTNFYPQIPTRTRIATNYQQLDYDDVLIGKTNVELSIYFEELYPPITLSPQSNFLTKLTYLSITNVRYSPEFFKVLFRCCKNLLTLNMEMTEDTGHGVAQVSRSLGLSQSLKNFRLAGEAIKFNKLYKGMCSCKTLENILIDDTSPTHVKSIGDPEYLIFCCEKLYSFCIEGCFTRDSKMKLLKLLNKVKKKLGRPYLNIEIANYKYDYDPFIEVFKLCNIKTITW